MSIVENLKKLKDQMDQSCRLSGRDEKSCQLIAVSKTKPLSMITEAIEAGQMDFGENYVQEASQKILSLSTTAKPPRWHFIGHLQSNKASQIVGDFLLIHSVDKLSLAEVLSKAAQKKNLIQQILVQINVASESSKMGASLSGADELIAKVNELPNLRLRGLMCLPPLTENQEKQRAYFRKLSELMRSQLVKLTDSQKSDFNILSMGTSHDFESAIFEGATHIRVGTAIFGARDYQ